jgi:hypothetical protein
MKTNSSQTVRCDLIRPLLSSYVEGELTDDDRLRVEAHLESCDACRKEEREYRISLGVLKNATPAPVPENLLSEFHSKLSSPQSNPRRHGFIWQLGTVGVAALLTIVFLKISRRIPPAPPTHNSMQARNASGYVKTHNIAMLPIPKGRAGHGEAPQSQYAKIPNLLRSAMPIEPRKKSGHHRSIRVAQSNHARRLLRENLSALSNTTSQKQNNNLQISAQVIASNLSRLERTKLAQKIAMLNQGHPPFEEDALPPVKAASPNGPMMTMMSEPVQAPVSRAAAPVSKPVTPNPPPGNLEEMTGFGGGAERSLMAEKTISSKISPTVPAPSMRLQGENIQRVNELIPSNDRVTLLKGERAINSSGELMWIRVVIETMLTPH